MTIIWVKVKGLRFFKGLRLRVFVTVKGSAVRLSAMKCVAMR